MINALTKPTHATITKHTVVPSKKAPAIRVKKVILEVEGHPALTDASVKLSAHRTDPTKMVLKCTSPERLAAAAAALGLRVWVPVVKGRKHYILTVNKARVAHKLGGIPGTAPALTPGTTAMVPMQKSQKHEEVITIMVEK